ncbi:MAG: hypothetical protein JWM80_2067 [Cyanobacteria bacterium RYN_339]|nr:hypothetical protein [Cyanobacteria bacterium RYN_339]
MRHGAWLVGAALALTACQPLEGLLKLKPDFPHAAASAVVEVAASPAADANPTAVPTETPGAQATAAPASATPAGSPTPTPTPFLDFLPVPQASTATAVATPTPKPTAKPTAAPTPSQPQTCTRTRQVISTGGPQHGRFNGAILPREWASVYANEDEILVGIDNIYQTDWACFQAFYPDASAAYKRLRGRS